MASCVLRTRRMTSRKQKKRNPFYKSFNKSKAVFNSTLTSTQNWEKRCALRRKNSKDEKINAHLWRNILALLDLKTSRYLSHKSDYCSLRSIKGTMCRTSSCFVRSWSAEGYSSGKRNKSRRSSERKSCCWNKRECIWKSDYYKSSSSEVEFVTSPVSSFHVISRVRGERYLIVLSVL